MFRPLISNTLASRPILLKSQTSFIRHPLAYSPARTFVTKDGTIQDSFARGLFLGVNFKAPVLPYPRVLDEEGTETVTSLLDPVEKFLSEQNNAAKNDSNSQIDPEVFQAMKEMGLFGLQVPQEHGGIGLTNTGYARFTEVMGAHDLGIGISLGAHQSIGFKGLLLDGNQEQKNKYLPKLASGEMVAAFCLTEPSSGSDANSIKSKATRDGKDWILNGSKIWISNGGIADFFTVFAQTEVPDSKTGGVRNKVTAFLVERSMKGVTSGPPEDKMGIKASNTAEVYFDNVRVPPENVLGEVGDGFKVAMRILNNGRFGMSSALTGTMKVAIKAAIQHASERVQFGSLIKEYGTIKEKIGLMTLKCYATESMAYLLSSSMDRGSTDYQIEAAISKVYASEAAWFTVDEAIQILGGMGYMKSAGLERVLRDLRIFRIFEGTNDILRLFIGLTGLQSTGEKLKAFSKALQFPFKMSNINMLVEEGSTRIKEKLFTPPPEPQVHPSLQKSWTLIEKATTQFYEVCEKSVLKHKKNIVDQQILVKYIANSAMELFAMAAVVSRASRANFENSPTASSETLMAETYCELAYKNIQQQLEGATKRTKVDNNVQKVGETCFKIGFQNTSTHPTGI